MEMLNPISPLPKNRVELYLESSETFKNASKCGIFRKRLLL